MAENNMTPFNVRKRMMEIPDYFDPGGAEGIDAVVQCIFTGTQASNWIIFIKDQVCTVEEGTAENPDIVIKAKGQTGVKLLTGEMDPMRAYLLGKVKINGDFTLGTNLVNLFKRP